MHAPCIRMVQSQDSCTHIRDRSTYDRYFQHLFFVRQTVESDERTIAYIYGVRSLRAAEGSCTTAAINFSPFGRFAATSITRGMDGRVRLSNDHVNVVLPSSNGSHVVGRMTCVRLPAQQQLGLTIFSFYDAISVFREVT